jgi:SAM-dependent methyltransferase
MEPKTCIDPQPFCLLCGQACTTVHSGLFDDRFGAPGTYSIKQCPACGLGQTWPRPGAAALPGLYERFYNAGIDPDSTYRQLRERLLASGLFRLWLKWDGDISLHRRQGRGRLLDIGCNEGRGLSCYARNGFQAEGLEINSQAAAAARSRGFRVYNRPLELFRPEQPYKVAVLSNVLEHALDPLAMLGQVRGILEESGEVWVSLPNAASRWRQAFGRSWINWHVPYHLWHFTPENLTEILGRSGFTITSMQSFTPSLWLAQSICGKLGKKVGQVNRLLRSSPVVAGLMLAARCLVLPFCRGDDRRLRGDCLVALARKGRE